MPSGIVGDPYEVIPRLMERNAEIAGGRRPYDPFGRGTVAGESASLFEV